MRTRDAAITFTIAAEETVVNDTVKVIARISGMAPRDSAEAKLRESIREMMGRFIPATWQYAGLTRLAHESGLETIALTASARIPEAENRALDKRRMQASLPDQGLTISGVTADLSFPASLVAATEQKLRLEIIRKSQEACAEIAAAMSGEYSIARLKFGARDAPSDNRYSNALMSASAATVKTLYGSGFESAGGEDILGNAQKFTMVATVTLARVADAPRA